MRGTLHTILAEDLAVDAAADDGAAARRTARSGVRSWVSASPTSRRRASSRRRRSPAAAGLARAELLAVWDDAGLATDRRARLPPDRRARPARRPVPGAVARRHPAVRARRRVGPRAAGPGPRGRARRARAPVLPRARAGDGRRPDALDGAARPRTSGPRWPPSGTSWPSLGVGRTEYLLDPATPDVLDASPGGGVGRPAPARVRRADPGVRGPDDDAWPRSTPTASSRAATVSSGRRSSSDGRVVATWRHVGTGAKRRLEVDPFEPLVRRRRGGRRRAVRGAAVT